MLCTWIENLYQNDLNKSRDQSHRLDLEEIVESIWFNQVLAYPVDPKPSFTLLSKYSPRHILGKNGFNMHVSTRKR